MKLDVLRSIGHNVADSLASGVSMLTGIYDTDPFWEAARSPDGYIDIDFLNGKILNGNPTPRFLKDVVAFHNALSVLCWKHRTSPSAFGRLEARYVSLPLSKHFVVTVESVDGRYAVDEYDQAGKRFIIVDELGRVRRKRSSIKSG